jgi:hypothetical protein
MKICLNQPRAIKIGLRAKFLLNSHVEGQSIDFYCKFGRFFFEKAQFHRS